MYIGNWHVPGTKQKALGTPTISVDDLQPWGYAGQQNFSRWQNSIFDGGKFAGGFGATQLQHVDYWTLRARSAQLYNESLYAKGIIWRLITNEIGTGLVPESTPDELLLGIDPDALADWADLTESRWAIWAKNPQLCDWKRQQTFGGIQRTARLAALIEGDVLVVMRQNPFTKLPNVQLINGNFVQTPLASDVGSIRKGHTIVQGVELNSLGRVVAYWIRQVDGNYKRQTAFGDKSGRQMAWLVFGSEKRVDEVRGQPILSVVLQSIKEIDRMRDSVQRKALVNSFIALFIKKTQDKIGSLPLSGGAIEKSEVEVTDNTGSRTLNVLGNIPGIAMENLQTGEEPVLLGGQGTDESFGKFEETIVQGIAWALQIPPEILTLSFTNNYSASQAALNEFKIYLNTFWVSWGENFCTPIYNDWLISETLTGKIKAHGLLAAWRNRLEYDTLGAWLSAEWYGSIKPTTDILKQAKGSELLVNNGWSTNTREARGISGTKYFKNIKRIMRENKAKAEALKPMLEIEQEFGVDKVDSAVRALEDRIELVEENIGSAENE